MAEETKTINVQTNGVMDLNQPPVKKVKLHEKMSKEDIDALILKKNREIKP